MSTPQRQLHFNAFLMSSGHHEAAWRLPESNPFANTDLSHWRDLARIAERARFDSLFLADGPAVRANPEFRPASALEPTVLLTALATATSHIGLIATALTTYNEPYNLARRFASLDHVSGGRAGWNIVTTADTASARNFGLDDRCIPNPWAPGALDAVQDGRPVVILGTGLTMLDVATAVTGDPRTTVRAVSRHGMLPQVHRGRGGPADSIWLPALSDTGDPVRLPELIWQVRAAMASRPNHWQDVVDAVRPHVPGLWRRLPDRDKRLFLRHVARYWEVHRHRMPPATARRMTELRCTGRLSVLRGRITGITEVPGAAAGPPTTGPAGGPDAAPAGGPPGPVRAPERLRIRMEQDGSVTDLAAGWLINATGPGTDLTRTTDPLLRDLLGRGLARPDPLRLGLDAGPDGAVLDAAGVPSTTLFTLGPPLRGIRYETTAIPEIRDQAAALAGLLTAAPPARQHPGSAA